MREYILNKNEAGQRLDKYLVKLFPDAGKGFLYKMLRKKNIVLNGKKAEGNEITAVGDSVKCFFSDETIENFQKSAKSIDNKRIEKQYNLDVIYEDDNVLLVNKPAGVLSQKADNNDISMVEIIINYLLDNGSITAEELKTFKPSVVNRLDRNTTGLLMAGKTLAGSQELSAVLKDRNMRKEYLCIVKGRLDKGILLDGYLHKDSKTNKVSIYKEKPPELEADRIYTELSPLCYNERCSLVLVHLITGKTHQIRSHLASIGHPIAGDGKYGDKAFNQYMNDKYKLKYQLLHAYRVCFMEEKGALNKLSGRTVYAPLPNMFMNIIKGEKLPWQPGQVED